jgi:hypothetical protein
MAEKRRNYELLLKRREQKLKNRQKRPNNDENVEELLFEQVKSMHVHGKRGFIVVVLRLG